MNSLMGNGNIMMQAMGAMMRGENPQMFLQGLAKNHPALHGMDFNNLKATAQNLCNQKGVDMNEMTEKIKDFAKSHIS